VLGDPLGEADPLTDGPLAEDVELLAEHQPDLLEERRELVCADP